MARPLKGGGSQPPEGGKPARTPFWRRPWFTLALAAGLALFLVTAASGAAGWATGRASYSATATIDAGIYMLNQYNLALEDMEAGNYELARQRLEFIFTQDPSFLDVSEKWIEVMLIIGETPEPAGSTLPSPTPTPTEDPRPKEELMQAAKALIAAQEWTAAIDTLLALRKADPSYMTTEVDGMFYVALRNRGIENILQLGLFEPGLYDFALAEEFGPLDGQASNYREWARLYLYGNAFWLAYPEEAAYYYGQLVGAAPDLRDSSGLSAFYRYFQSLLHIGDRLSEQEEWCDAYDAYQTALSVGSSSAAQPTLAYAQDQCLASIPSDTPTITPTLTLTQTLFVTLTPTPTGATPSPTATGATTTATSSGATATPSNTAAAATATPSNTPSNTPTPSSTPTPTASATP